MLKKFHRIIATFLSVLLVGTMMMPVTQAQEAPEGASTYAYASQLDLRLLAEAGLLSDAAGNGIEVLELMEAVQVWRNTEHNNQEPDIKDINVGLLEIIHLDLPGLRIPLIGREGVLNGLILDDNLGLLKEYAHTPAATRAWAAAGLVNNDGSLNLSDPGDGGNVSLDLTSLLKLDPVLSPILDTAALELGALSAASSRPDAFLTDGIGECSGTTGPSPLNDRFCSDYQIADAMLIIKSPLVEDLVTGIESLVEGLSTTLSALVGEEGFIDSLLGLVSGLGALVGTGVKITATVPLTDITDQLVAVPIKDESGLLSIDLKQGTISIDLKQLHSGNLDNLPPNTPLVSDEQLIQITDSLTSLLTDSKEQNPYSLAAHVDSMLRGREENGVHKGGLYGTEISIHLEVLSILGLLGGTINLKTTLGGLLNDNVEKVDDPDVYETDKYDLYLQETTGLLGSLVGLVTDILSSAGGLVGDLVFGANGVGGLLGDLIGNLQEGVVAPLLSSLQPLLEGVVAPLVQVIINRQKIEQTDQGNLFTTTALEVNLLEGNLVHLPLATASVMAQSFNPTSLELGKFLDDPNSLVPENSEFTLNYVCTHEDFTEAYTNPDDPEAANEVLDRLQGQIVLGAGETQVIETLPVGASCEVTEEKPDINQPGWDWTHDWTADRGWDAATEIIEEAEPVILEAGMTPQFIAAVNRYRIGDRKVAISKITAGSVEEGTTYTFEYSTDNGNNWTSAQIKADEAFIIEAPVLNSDGTPFQLQLREVLETAALPADAPNGPEVTWTVDEAQVTNSYSTANNTWYASTNFEIQPADPAAALSMQVKAINSYAQVQLNKNIPGLSLGGSVDTTVLPYGTDTMTIRYEVDNTGPVALNKIELFDASLSNALFILPDGVSVDPSSGLVSGHSLSFDAEGKAFWELKVTLDNPDQDFHYEAAQAGATVKASTTVDNRTITAQDSDQHGAFRLSDLVAMLPATGVTTLVWVLGLGLLIAIGALVLFIRSRK